MKQISTIKNPRISDPSQLTLSSVGFQRDPIADKQPRLPEKEIPVVASISEPKARLAPVRNSPIPSPQNSKLASAPTISLPASQEAPIHGAQPPAITSPFTSGGFRAINKNPNYGLSQSHSQHPSQSLSQTTSPFPTQDTHDRPPLNTSPPLAATGIMASQATPTKVRISPSPSTESPNVLVSQNVIDANDAASGDEDINWSRSNSPVRSSDGNDHAESEGQSKPLAVVKPATLTPMADESHNMSFGKYPKDVHSEAASVTPEIPPQSATEQENVCVEQSTTTQEDTSIGPSYVASSIFLRRSGGRSVTDSVSSRSTLGNPVRPDDQPMRNLIPQKSKDGLASEVIKPMKPNVPTIRQTSRPTMQKYIGRREPAASSSSTKSMMNLLRESVTQSRQQSPLKTQQEVVRSSRESSADAMPVKGKEKLSAVQQGESDQRADTVNEPLPAQIGPSVFHTEPSSAAAETVASRPTVNKDVQQALKTSSSRSRQPKPSSLEVPASVSYMMFRL